MKNKISPICLPNSFTYNILGNLQVTVTVERNVYEIPVESLFLMAARRNAKRGFLFVSKVLGKHIPVHPLIPLIGGGMLAARYGSMIHDEQSWEEQCDFTQSFANPEVMKKTWEYMQQNPLPLPKKTLFIGFAETATALGHSVFAAFAGNAQYIHTTREQIVGINNILNFSEEHSHATEHYCYAMDSNLFANEDSIALVDDEITTGKSALNFIRAIQQKYPRQEYAVLSLLDWRSAAEQEKFAMLEQELGITIHMISLLAGNITVQGEPVVVKDEEQPLLTPCPATTVVEHIMITEELGDYARFSSVNGKLESNHQPYLRGTGRFGLASKEQEKMDKRFEQVGQRLKTKRKGQKTLCLGTGEFMYIPFKIAGYMGEGVCVQSTTRSPVYPAQHVDYAVRSAISFPCPEDDSVMNYVYNIPANYYDEVFIFVERAAHQQGLAALLQAFAPLSIPRIYCVTCAGECK